MPITDVHASTQDGTSGTLVSTVAVADGSGGNLQAMVQLGSKTDYTELARTGITAADTATDMSASGFAGASGANLTGAYQALAISLRATCNMPGAILTGHLVFYDGSNNPLSVSEPVTFQSGTFRVSASGNYLGQRQVLNADRSVKCAFYVDSLSGGTWNVYVQACSTAPTIGVSANSLSSFQILA